MEEKNNIIDNHIEFDTDELELLKRFESTPEEMKAYKEETERKLQEKGYLPSSSEYQTEFQSSQEAVEQEPKHFIMPECLPACKELWNKNVYTYMVSDHGNEGECWIEVVADFLSDENKDVYMQLEDEDIIKFSYHHGTLNFGVKCVGQIAQQKLLEMAKQFKMQDVPMGLGGAYLKTADFLIRYCDCYEEYDNPTYKPMKPIWKMENISIEEQIKYIQKYSEWEHSEESKPKLIKFAKEKVVKPIEEYAKEHNMIYEDGRVYFSEFHYNKHKNYIQYMNDQEKQGGNHHI